MKIINETVFVLNNMELILAFLLGACLGVSIMFLPIYIILLRINEKVR